MLHMQFFSVVQIEKAIKNIFLAYLISNFKKG